jgi:hypothetical protein
MSNALHSSLINDIATGSTGTTWVATRDGGLAKIFLTPDGETSITHLNATGGLHDNTIFSVAIDEHHQTWYNSPNGIGYISSDGKRTNFFNVKTGLPFAKFQQSINCIPGDMVATVTENNFFSFYTPATLQYDDNNMVIERVQLNDTIAIDTNRQTFTYHENTIRIDYSLLDFTAPGGIEYYCILEGFDKDWVNNGNQSNIRYANLKPGKYLFKVKAKKPNGEFNKTEASWAFVIGAPFWQATWFKLSLFALVLFAAWYLYRQRIRKARKDERVKNEYEKKIAEVEMLALRAQMNPHFMFNSLNSINNFILKNDPDNASGYLTKFSRLMRLILDNSRSEWVLLENELKALELYIQLEAVRFDNAFEYSLEVGGDINTGSITVPPMLIQPYVENAIWHGLLHRKEPGGRIDIKLWKNTDTLYIEMEDNGIGREEAKRLKSKTATRHKSHGMTITAERMEIVNRIYNVDAGVTVSDIDDNRGKTGTRVTITFKYRIYEGDHRG